MTAWPPRLPSTTRAGIGRAEAALRERQSARSADQRGAAALDVAEFEAPVRLRSAARRDERARWERGAVARALPRPAQDLGAEAVQPRFMPRRWRRALGRAGKPALPRSRPDPHRQERGDRGGGCRALSKWLPGQPRRVAARVLPRPAQESARPAATLWSALMSLRQAGYLLPIYVCN